MASGITLLLRNVFLHLSKPKSDPKQKCTQLMTLFSGTVCYALSHGGILFAQSVSFESQLNKNLWLGVREFPPFRKWFLGLTPQAKQITPCGMAWNTVPENSVRNGVHFCLQSLEPGKMWHVLSIINLLGLKIPKKYIQLFKDWFTEWKWRS